MKIKNTNLKIKSPNGAKLIKNFAKAVIKAGMAGFPHVDDDIVKQRLAICDQCEYKYKNRCLHSSCGCCLTPKALWATEECPLGKWKAVE